MCFLEEGRPVLDSSKEVADMDEVKVVVFPGPGQSCVCDLKVHVWRNPFRLGG